MDYNEKEKIVNAVTQVAFPVLTIGAQIATSLKYPQLGLVVNLAAQPFWIYSAWKSFRCAGRIGLLINSVIFTIVTAAGIVNYWFL